MEFTHGRKFVSTSKYLPERMKAYENKTLRMLNENVDDGG
jgi:hypothetical protein